MHEEKTVSCWSSFKIHGILVQDPFWHSSCNIFNTGQYHAPVLIARLEIEIVVKYMSNEFFPFTKSMKASTSYINELLKLIRKYPEHLQKNLSSKKN